MRRLLAAFLLLATTFSAWGQDKFADIATGHYTLRRGRLVEPQPPQLPERYLPTVHDPSSVFEPMARVEDREGLYVELDSMKSYYAPFLRSVAPELSSGRTRLPLKSFDWRIATEADYSNFQAVERGEGSWEQVAIPHYGPPLGRARTCYRKVITLSEELFEAGELFACFKGVDYKAQVYFNGNLVGTHTGFFAPFECNLTSVAHSGENTLLVVVENDYTTTGSNLGGENIRGNKIYAATGPGYDEPTIGWHHCPAGMGIYQDCYIEARSPLHINDIFVRPLPSSGEAEAWIEINNFHERPEAVTLQISVWGENFEQCVIEPFDYSPHSQFVPGVGDLAKPTDHQRVDLKMGYGVNQVKLRLDMGDFRRWTLQEPWLYEIQIALLDEQGKRVDGATQHFGMRSFVMDTLSLPKGKMYLNDQPIRLRGANTMGHLQQCVMRGDTTQLIEDILLAKLCNMNYLRLTQRPVQPEIYEMCDRLGLLNQTDLPLFGSLRRNLMAEAVKQAEEMERLVRSHPSTIMVSYINERFPNAEGQPQRSFADLEEYERLFTAFDQAVLLSNPDRVIKAGDGDYDPPSPGLPDNHCYNGWYNGHGLGLGALHRGYWQPTKPDWYYACGEYGSEGLDPKTLMYDRYPSEWLPETPQQERTWTPQVISQAQTQRFHYMWYDTPEGMDEWISSSWEHQSWVTKFTTEAFRRDNRMVSSAIHLFIDAFPAGWMKTIMDVNRDPKPAYFAYRYALSPLMVSLRTDRWNYYVGEEVSMEAWLSNDHCEAPGGTTLSYQLEQGNKVLFAQRVPADMVADSSAFQGYICFEAPAVRARTKYTLRISLNDESGAPIHQNVEHFEVFPAVASAKVRVMALGSGAEQLAKEAGAELVGSMQEAQTLLVVGAEAYLDNQEQIDKWVELGGRAVLCDLSAGDYTIGGSSVKIENTTMGEYYFASARVSHPKMRGFQCRDFWFWYDTEAGYATPQLGHTIAAQGWTPLLRSGNSNWLEDKGEVMAACELRCGEGLFRVCEVDLLGRLSTNPTAARFAKLLLEK